MVSILTDSPPNHPCGSVSLFLLVTLSVLTVKDNFVRWLVQSEEIFQTVSEWAQFGQGQRLYIERSWRRVYAYWFPVVACNWQDFTSDADSPPVVSKWSLLINYLLGKRLGYARGEDGRREASFPSSPSLKSPF